VRWASGLHGLDGLGLRGHASLCPMASPVAGALFDSASASAAALCGELGAGTP
jgi:hypothetical protein